MKKFAFFLIFVCSTLFSAEFPLRYVSVIQRGILTVNETQIPINVITKTSENLRIMLANEFGNMAKLEVSHSGDVIKLENGAFMSPCDAHNFFLRDVMACMGFEKFFEPNIIHSFIDNKHRIIKIVLLDECVEFDYSYSDDFSKTIPKRIFIKRKSYTLDLETIKIFHNEQIRK